jgi:hypothetical protein
MFNFFTQRSKAAKFLFAPWRMFFPGVLRENLLLVKNEDA